MRLDSAGVRRMNSKMLSVTDRPIDFASLIARCAGSSDGAVATFTGIVRDRSDSKKVTALQYEAYVPMVLKCFAEISGEVKAKWAVSNISIAHRTGRLRVGETAVAVAVSAPHRREALEACAYAIDRIKTLAPIWKKEFYDDEEGMWIESCGSVQEKEQHVHAY